MDNTPTVLRVNLNSKTGGFFYEPSPSLSDGSINEGSLLRNNRFVFSMLLSNILQSYLTFSVPRVVLIVVYAYDESLNT